MNSERKQGWLNIDSSLYNTRISSKFENRQKYVPADPKKIVSYIPGTVLELLVSPGKKVMKGDELVILDAMKMKNRIKSPAEGIVRSVPVNRGDKVAKGTVLIELE